MRRISFGGCDYLGLSRDARVIAAGAAAMQQFGAGARGSRVTVGSTPAHGALEGELARFFGCADAVSFPSGWLVAGAVAAALAPEHERLLVVRGAHPAVLEGARATGCKIQQIDAKSVNLQKIAARGARDGRLLLFSDAIHLAAREAHPVEELYKTARASRGSLVLDDAHGAGVLGAHGRGTAEWLCLQKTNVYICGSLSKAFGVAGGFVAGSRVFCKLVRERAAAFRGATPLAPALAAAAAEAVRIARFEGPRRRAKLTKNIRRLESVWSDLGLPVTPSPIPWLNISPRNINIRGSRGGETGSPAAARVRLLNITKNLRARGIDVPHLEYFGGPPGGYLRFSVTAGHTSGEIGRLHECLQKILRDVC